MLSDAVAEFLTRPEGESVVAVASSLARDGTDTLHALARLRKSFPVDIAAAAWDLAQIRQRAVKAIGDDGATLFFDRDGFQMASATGCASYHAKLIAEVGATHVLDLCAGVGMDALSIARQGIRVTAYESDPARAVFARANAAVTGLADRIVVVCSDVTTTTFPRDVHVAFFDPARRDENRKQIVSSEHVLPPLSFLDQIAQAGVDSVLVKLSPAIDRNLGAQWNADTELLSESGQCKEALLRIGRFRSGAGMSAVLLPGLERLDSPTPQAEVRELIGQWLYEPDPAVIRAGLVGHVAHEVDGWLIDSHIAYVLSDQQVETKFADTYRIETGFPYHLKRLQDELVSRDVGRVVVKRRGFPEEPEEIRKQLKLRGSQERVVVLSSSGNRLWAMIGTRAAG